jgi:hypothetical protein
VVITESNKPIFYLSNDTLFTLTRAFHVELIRLYGHVTESSAHVQSVSSVEFVGEG